MRKMTVVILIAGAIYVPSASADVLQISATGTSEDRGGGLVTTTDWTLEFDDLNGDQQLQITEIISFSGTTVTTAQGSYGYDEVAGTPEISGISTLSGGFNDCCWWLRGPTMIGPEDGWFPDRWTYVIANISQPDPDVLFEQLAENTVGVGPGRLLERMIGLANTYFDVPDVQSACAVLQAFDRRVQLFGILSQIVRRPAPWKISMDQTDDLLNQSGALQTAIGCT